VDLRYDVNVSILFTELPLLERPQAAREAGFSAVESWWPFDTPVPADQEVERFVGAVRDAGVRLVSLNAYGGDMASGERGVASLPGREAEFRDNLDVAVGLAQALECPTLHVLYGNRDGSDPAVRTSWPSSTCASRPTPQPVSAPRSSSRRSAALSATRCAPPPTRCRSSTGSEQGPAFLCDVYHLSVNGEDPVGVIRRHADRIGHVQLADAPGRHQPGTGTVDVDGCLAALSDVGYTGWVGLEYAPLGPERLVVRLVAGPALTRREQRPGLLRTSVRG
jgi:hydroxypyruvate isomerase